MMSSLQQTANMPEASSGKWSEKVTFVSGVRKAERLKSLNELDDRNLCETIRAHFDSHPTLPGEKITKDTAKKLLNDHPEGEIKLDAEQRDALIKAYADTCIRQTSVNMAGVHPEDLCLETVNPAEHMDADYMQDIVADGRVKVSIGKAKLQKNGPDMVCVMAKRNDQSYEQLCTVSDKFLKNNPMNVDSCEADLQLVDYSHGEMKNISAKVVVDTDRMSGDIIDLNDDMLAGLDEDFGLEQ